jgi:ABC-type uncharacterized transport system permease subunit
MHRFAHIKLVIARAYQSKKASKIIGYVFKQVLVLFQIRLHINPIQLAHISSVLQLITSVNPKIKRVRNIRCGYFDFKLIGLLQFGLV